MLNFVHMFYEEVSALKRKRRVLLMLHNPVSSRSDYLVLGVIFLFGMILGHLCGRLLREPQRYEVAA